MQMPGCGLRVLVPGLIAMTLAGQLLPRPATAQSVTGTILGVAKDPVGVPVAGVAVTLVHDLTGFARVVTTDARGDFVAPLLPTGSYTASAELAGFSKAILPAIHVSVDQRVRIELRLGALERADVIEVQAETPLLQT